MQIAEGTLYRWRWQGTLLTAFDYLCDPDLRRRIELADERGEEYVSGAMPEARFDLEDVTRLSVLGYLRESVRWDAERLIRVLRKPYIEPFQTQSDGHTARDQRVMPRFLLIYPEGGDRLNRVVVDAWKQVGRVLAEHPESAHVVDLRYYREIAQQELALVELERERRAALAAKAKAKRAVKAGKLTETEMAKV